ncbi:hypothetical protein V2J09_007271 [Rumex salicifolius]
MAEEEEEENIDWKEGKFSGFVLDPEKCSQLTLVEKRELVHEIAQWPEDAPKILSSFTRRELLEIICAEMGKERKYTGLAKGRMIDLLLNVVLTNKRKQNPNASIAFLPVKSQPGAKRQKKIETLSNSDLMGGTNHIVGEVTFLLCENLACRAALGPEDGFCRRCSCCICHAYDDNKDPSLWLTCNSDPPNDGVSCGLSCHLKCALKNERSGLPKNSCYKLDGQFSCVACGKVNDLMSTWNKQLVIGKEARRVDALCLRISLCYKILDGTKLYKDLHELVDTAAKKLKKELGPLDRVCAKMGRGIVNRLVCGAEVQKLCTSALEIYHNILSKPYLHPELQHKSPTCRIRFEDSYSTSVMIVLDYDDHLFENFLGCRLWHQECSSKSYPDKPTCIVLRPEKKFKICNLNPSTEYMCKVSLFSCTQVYGTWEAKWLTPSNKTVNVMSNHDHSQLNWEKLRSLNDINNDNILMSPHMETLPLPSPVSIPTTPSKLDGKLSFHGLTRQSGNADFDYCVRVIKALESEGYLSLDFRVKFLTWYSLKATKQDRRVVSAFVDVMGDDPSSLAEQLIDAFTDEICGGKHLMH